jgi:hypothetical protein
MYIPPIDIIKIYFRFEIYRTNILTLRVCSEFNNVSSSRWKNNMKYYRSEKNEEKYKAINILFYFILLRAYLVAPVLIYINIHTRTYVELFTRFVVYILFRLFPPRVLVRGTRQSISRRVFYFSLVTHFSIISVLRTTRTPYHYVYQSK